MTDIDIDKALHTKRKSLGLVDRLSFFVPVLFFYSILIHQLYLYLKALQVGIEIDYSALYPDLGILHVFTLIGTIVLITKIHSLRYKVIDVNVSPRQFEEVINRLIDKHKWSICTKGETYVVVSTETNFFFKNERITIIYSENCILVNSICNPDNFRQLFSLGENNLNIYRVKEAFTIEATIPK